MKYIQEKGQKQNDFLGITLGCIYLFSIYLAGNFSIPIWFNRGSLIVFLAYGTLTIITKIIRKTYSLSSYSIWYGIFIIYTLISFTFSTKPLEIESNHFYQMIVCFIITLLLIEHIHSERDFSWICWAFVLASFIMVVLLYINGELIGDYKNRLGDDISGNANVFATFIMYSVMYAIWLIIYKKHSFLISAFLCVCIILNFYALMLSGGRKFFVVPFVFFFVLLLYKNSISSTKKTLQYSVLMVVVMIVIYMLLTQIPSIYNAIGIRMEQFINSITGKGAADESSIIRSQMRSAAINEWIKKPLFGYGFNTYIHLRTPELFGGGSHPYSHCNYTELLYSGGIVYFCIYYSLWFFILLIMRKNKGQIKKGIAFTIAAMISQFVLDYGGVFYDIIATQVFIMMAVKALEIGIVDTAVISFEKEVIYE